MVCDASFDKMGMIDSDFIMRSSYEMYQFSNLFDRSIFFVFCKISLSRKLQIFTLVIFQRLDQQQLPRGIASRPQFSDVAFLKYLQVVRSYSLS